MLPIGGPRWRQNHHIMCLASEENCGWYVLTLTSLEKPADKKPDVLNVSKLTAGLITLVEADFRPYDEVYNVVRMFRDEVAARGLQLVLEKDDSWDRLMVDVTRGDSGRFTQIIVNLLRYGS
jgi:signal transduction histidine kinase